MSTTRQSTERRATNRERRHVERMATIERKRARMVKRFETGSMPAISGR
ncbi:hypothetical protein [Agromyces sp. NPDC058104]